MSTMIEEILSGQSNAGQPSTHNKKHCGCSACRHKRRMGRQIPAHLAEAEDNHLLGEVFNSPPATVTKTVAGSTTPALLTEENNAGGYTAYVGIDLQMSKDDLISGFTCIEKNEKGACIKSKPSSWAKSVSAMTAIYAPSGYKPSDPTDVVIYLHGHKTGIPGANTNIKDYLNYSGDSTLKLREVVAASGRNVILVAPTLGPLAQPGKLTSAGNFDSYVAQAISAIKAYVLKKYSYSGQFNFNKLIIAAHSGGGKAMLSIVKMPDTLSKSISEVWGFDCWYQASSEWTKYAAANTSVKIFAYYYNSQLVPAKATNTCIVHSPYGHFPLITIYLKQRLANAACAAAPSKKKVLRRRKHHEMEMENTYGEKGGGRVTIKKDPDSSQVSYIPRAGGGKVPIHTTTKAAWEKLIEAARADGIKAPHLLPVSGYRSSKTQKRLWESALERYGSPEVARKWVAPPGSSAHQSGRAIDFYLGLSNSSKNVTNLRKTKPYQWLAGNATRFGFYPYSNEPWHWEHNPPE